MQLKLNTLNLNTGWYSVQEIAFDSAPAIEFSDMSFAAGDGAKFITSKFTPKTITIGGRITQSTVALLEAEMDNFKKILLSNPNINLNFSFANGFRQYVGNIKDLSLTRKYFNITYVPFEITFVAGDPPFSQAIDNIDSVVPNLSEVFSADQIIGNAYTHTLSMTGTAPPLAKWTYLLDAVSGRIQQMVFKSLTTGKQMEINEAMSAGDEIIIDEESLEVTLNSIDHQYEGVFPTFNLGGNELEWQIYGQSSDASGLYLDQTQLFYEQFTLSIGPGAYFQYGVQTFVPSYTAQLGRISLLLYRPFKNSTGNIYVYIYNTSSGIPTTSLATSSTIIDVANIPQSSWTWYDFNFTGITLTSGTTYAIVIYCSGTASYYNYIASGMTYNFYANGSVFAYKTSWYNYADYDLTFKTYMSLSSTTPFSHESSLKIEQKKRFL